MIDFNRIEFEVLYPDFYPATGKDEEYVVVRRTKVR